MQITVSVLFLTCRPMCIVLFMAALHSRCEHYIFTLWFLSSSSLFFIPRLVNMVWP